MKSVLAVLLMVALARAQIPSLGFCPEYLPMGGFDMERFSGIWYEAERYFQLSEVASRCVKSNYTRGPDGKFRVLNEVTSIFTGIKRVVEGEIRKAPSKAEEGRLHVKYTSVPLIPLETQYNVLETDYKNYAVLWSCSGVGPVNTQNAWIMTRQRVASGEILQRAYAVLDKYKISKLFFMKTNQEDCAYLDTLEAEQNIRPPAEPTKTDSAEYEESDDVPQPLTKAAAAIPEPAPVEPVVPAVPVAPVAPVAAPEPAVKASVADVKDSVVNAVKNAADAVKKAAAAIKNAAIKQPAPAPVEAAPAVAAAPVPVAAPAAAVEQPIKEAVKEPVKESVKESVKEPVKESVKVAEVVPAKAVEKAAEPTNEVAVEEPKAVVAEAVVEKKKQE